MGKIGSWIMINKVKALIIGLVAAIAIGGTATGIILATGGDNTTNDGSKRVPVYQGMTISSAKDTASVTGGITLASSTSDATDSEKTPGTVEGDVEGRNDSIDEANPYPENGKNETIEEEIKSSLDVVGSTQSIYYATPGEDIYINIHINNPDSFEIMSFTLNGKKYSSYMFEEGSDMETIVLKYNVGDASGIVEYTIDAIKYVDGEDIKDVIIDGDKTVKAGIKTNEQLKVEITNSNITANAISFNVSVTDKDSLITFSEGTLKAVIYDGESIVYEQSLAVGDNSISFEALKTNTLYQYAIIGYYDDFSGAGFGMNMLHKDAFYTDSIMLFDNVTVDQSALSFGFLKNDNYSTAEISALKLYKNGTLVRELDTNATEISELLSSNTYTLVAEYLNGNTTESISIVFTTEAKATPDITIANTDKSQTSLDFTINVTDTDSVGAITKVELIHGTDVTALNNVTSHTISDLLSNNDYTIKVTYTYDLNDGAGSKTIVQEFTAKTKAKATPDVAISNTGKTKDSLSFGISVTDADSVGAITKVELLHATEDTKVLTNSLTHSISELLSDNTYSLKVTYSYDLNDGEGIKELTKTLDEKTEAKTTPTFSIISTSKTQNSISFGIKENDADNVGEISKIELIHNGTATVANNINVREFENLLSNNNYTLKITYTYNLNNGEGAKTIIDSSEIKTDAKTVPSITFDSTTANSSSVSFGINEVDIDNVGEIIKLELLLGNDVIKTSNDGSLRKFEDLLSNTEYTVRATYRYNLCDGSDEVTVIKTVNVKTNENNIPYILISGGTQTQTSVGFAIEESDSSNIGSITKIELYKDNVLVKVAENTNVREFTGLLSNTNYTVKVTYIYNLNDNSGNHTETREIKIKTLSMAKPSIIFEETDRTKTSVIFDFNIVDVNNIGHIERIELIKNGDVVNYTTDPTATEFRDILSNTSYTVKVIYAYDLNEGNGTEYIEKTADIKTYEKETPNISIHSPTKSQTSVGFAITENDTDNVGEISKIEVYLGGVLVKTADSISAREFTGLLSNNTYTVKLTYVYNLNDGDGNHTVIKELSIKTDAKATPEVTITNTDKTQTSLKFSVSIVDTDSVGAITKVELIHASGVTTLENVTAHEIKNLLSNNDYTLKVTYTYNLNDGKGAQTITKELAVKTEAKAIPEVTVTNTDKTQTSLKFSVSIVDTDSVGAITKVELIHASSVTTLENVATHEINDLLSNNNYTLKITYTYNLNDGVGNRTIVKELTVKTIAKAIPEVTITNTDKTQTSLKFSVSIVDTDSVGAITKVELIHASSVTTLENVTAHEVKNLLSNNNYTLRVTYTYDLNDGIGTQTITKELSAKTVAKTAPNFTVKDENIGTDCISAKYDVTDADNILSSYKIELYQGNTLISENKEKKINFSSLSYYTDYTVKFTYKYDLNDGNGTQTKTYDYSFKTLPYIDVTECKIANTGAVSEGNTIYMEVKLNNPLGMTIESVVINGETYSVTAASTKNKIFVEIVYNGQFAGGDTYLKVDTVNAKIDGSDYIATPETELSDNVFINGRVEVLAVEYVDEEFKKLEDGSWIFPSKKVYELVTLNNPTGYVMDSLLESGYTKLDDNRYYLEASYCCGWLETLSISSISYHNEYITKTLDIATVSNKNYVYRVYSDEVKYISTPADLKNMSGGYYYELTCDIDLDGIEWIQYSSDGNVFNGVFNGNGYSIKNMSFVGDIENSNTYLGLFSKGEGIIQSLKIEEATIIANAKSDDESTYSIYYGGLVAYANGHLHLYECEVDEYTSVSIKNSAGNAYVGGLVGYGYSSINITDSYNSSDVSATGYNKAYAGGLVGYDLTIDITDSYNSGNVSAIATGNNDAYAGGLVGYGGSTVNITSSYNSGNVSATATGNNDAYASGLVGYGNNYSTINITSSYNSGNVSATATTGHNNAYAGGLVGQGSTTITSSYNSGNVCATGNYSAYAGGLVGYGYGSGSTIHIKDSYNSGSITSRDCAGGLVASGNSTINITNSYSLVSGDRYNGEACTVEQLNSKEFYTDVLDWSEDIWDFTELDVENGKSPILKAFFSKI